MERNFKPLGESTTGSTLPPLLSLPFLSLTEEASTHAGLRRSEVTYQAPWPQAFNHNSDVGHTLPRSFLERSSKWLVL